jgi:hypothetical protein
MTEADHELLAMLAWRYAALVGILGHPEDVIEREILESDKSAYGDIVKTEEGIPLFDCEQGIKFLMNLSGLPAAYCRAVLCEQWPNEACSECGSPSRTVLSGQRADNETHNISVECVSCAHAESRVVDCEAEFCEFCARQEAGL